MRVLVCLADERVGGPQVASTSVARELKQYNIVTEFLVPGTNPNQLNHEIWGGFTVHQPGLRRLHPPSEIFENAKTAFQTPSAIRKIINIIKRRDIDIVHVRMTQALRGAVAAKLSNTPFLYHFNDTSMTKLIAYPSSTFARLFADKISVAAEAVHDYYFPDSITSSTLYAPVNPSQFDPDNVTEKPELGSNIDIDCPVILSVGNLNPVKGYSYFLRSLPDVIAKHGPVTVLVAGAHPSSQDDYTNQIYDIRGELGLEETVHFLGQRDDIPELLSKSDLFVLPSISEACPIVVLEAMAMRVPIVATNVGGVSEQLPSSKYGIVVESEDPNALANGISEVLTDPESADERATRAGRRVEDKFSVNSIARDHRDVYEQILCQNNNE